LRVRQGTEELEKVLRDDSLETGAHFERAWAELRRAESRVEKGPE
jgi:hypothetical protein